MAGRMSCRQQVAFPAEKCAIFAACHPHGLPFSARFAIYLFGLAAFAERETINQLVERES